MYAKCIDNCHPIRLRCVQSGGLLMSRFRHYRARGIKFVFKYEAEEACNAQKTQGC